MPHPGRVLIGFTNQHTVTQGTPKPDFRVNLVSRRRVDWALPGFGSVCARADQVLDVDVVQSVQTLSWVWDRERPNLVLRAVISA
jgi:hypothetical protein